MDKQEMTFYRDAILRGEFWKLHLGIICSTMGRTHHFNTVADTIPHALFRDLAVRLQSIPLDPRQNPAWYRAVNVLIDDVNAEKAYQIEQLRRKRGY